MAKTAVTQWDVVAANNTDINSISILGTAPVSNFDNAFRELMAQIATFNTGATFTGITTLGSSAGITSTASGTLLSLTSTDAGATGGPGIELYRNSASPAASDSIGQVVFYGKDSAGNKQYYGDLSAIITDATSTTEDSRIYIATVVAGTPTVCVNFGAGFYTNGATGTDMGAGTINATAYYVNGVALTAPLAEATAAQYRANTADLMLTTDQVWAAAAEVTLTDAATIAVDFSTFINGVVTLAGNRAMGNPTNEKVGQSGVIRIVQDGTGSRTLSYGTDWEFAGGTAPVLSTAAAAQDLLFYHIIAADRVYASLVKAVV